MAPTSRPTARRCGCWCRWTARRSPRWRWTGALRVAASRPVEVLLVQVARLQVGMLGTMTPYTIDLADSMRQTETYLERLAATLRADGIPSRVSVVESQQTTADAILALADPRGQRIVMATHGRGPAGPPGAGQRLDGCPGAEPDPGHAGARPGLRGSVPSIHPRRRIPCWSRRPATPRRAPADATPSRWVRSGVGAADLLVQRLPGRVVVILSVVRPCPGIRPVGAPVAAPSACPRSTPVRGAASRGPRAPR